MAVPVAAADAAPASAPRPARPRRQVNVRVSAAEQRMLRELALASGVTEASIVRRLIRECHGEWKYRQAREETENHASG